ncbi:hypothetical protein AJ79_06572 [Helicocarpus griseus UAMH5409]|uniref:Uncharacterized protein n=1 Tax=Helicocarpus griseus UAMH5409 TaxID=1447875 RepID=A0A2B7XBQ8_9EURO|nr:hypothetical protein AJ79_06572 [Helicocarpus griseus UAMH5409]
MDDQGRTPIHWAIIGRGILRAVRTLADSGMDPPFSTSVNPLLHAAVENHNLEIVQFLVGRGANLNAVNPECLSPTHVAAKLGNVKILGFLLNAGVGVDQFDEDERTPLAMAAENGHHDAVAALLEAEADVNGRGDNSFTALHFAASRGDDGMVKLLLSKGANIRASDDQSQIPLHIAASFGHTSVVKRLLLEWTNRQLIRKDYQGQTPLHVAAPHGQLAVAIILLNSGANPNIGDSTGRSPLHVAISSENLDLVKLLIEHSSSLDNKDKCGETPMHLAQKLGLQTIARLLQDKGADVRLTTNDGTSLLHFAASSNDVDTVRMLLSDQHDPKAMNNRDETPLLLAASGGHGGVVKLLLEANAHPDGPSDSARPDFKTPLLVAASAQHIHVTRLLLQAGANPNFLSRTDDETPFFWVLKKGPLTLVKEFLDRGIDPDASSRWPPLYTVPYLGCVEVVRLLIESGIDSIEHCGPDNWTPLHAAYDSAEVTRTLLNAGAAVNCQTLRKPTPLLFAAYDNCHETVAVLLEFKADPFLENDIQETPFHYLMFDTLKEHVERILQRPGCLVNVHDNLGRTPLWKAVSNGASGIVDLLLRRKDLETTASVKGDDLLSLAIRKANLNIIEMLFRKGVSIEDQHTGLIHRCAARGETDLMRILLAHRNDIGNVVDEHGWSTFIHARSMNQRKFLRDLWPTVTVEKHLQSLEIEKVSCFSASMKSDEIELANDQLVAFVVPSKSLVSISARTGPEILMELTDVVVSFQLRVKAQLHR